MSNERDPMLSDEHLRAIRVQYDLWKHTAVGRMPTDWSVRDHYERLITEGKLRVVEHASPVHKLSGLLCSICSISWQDDQYCRGCGNKIKR
jgi:hypothetical protein